MGLLSFEGEMIGMKETVQALDRCVVFFILLIAVQPSEV